MLVNLSSDDAIVRLLYTTFLQVCCFSGVTCFTPYFLPSCGEKPT